MPRAKKRKHSLKEDIKEEDIEDPVQLYSLSESIGEGKQAIGKMIAQFRRMPRKKMTPSKRKIGEVELIDLEEEESSANSNNNGENDDETAKKHKAFLSHDYRWELVSKCMESPAKRAELLVPVPLASSPTDSLSGPELTDTLLKIQKALFDLPRFVVDVANTMDNGTVQELFKNGSLDFAISRVVSSSSASASASASPRLGELSGGDEKEGEEKGQKKGRWEERLEALERDRKEDKKRIEELERAGKEDKKRIEELEWEVERLKGFVEEHDTELFHPPDHLELPDW